MRVCIIKTYGLGGVVRTTSLVPALKRRCGDCSIDWVADQSSLPLVELHPGIDRILTVEAINAQGSLSEDYDWVISLDDIPAPCRAASQLITAKRSGAFARPDGTIEYTHDLEPWFGMGRLRLDTRGGMLAANQLRAVNRRTYGEILYECLGLDLPIDRPQIHLSRSDHMLAEESLAQAGVAHAQPLVALNASAGPRWERKKISEGQAAAMCRTLVEQYHATVLLTGGADEIDRNRAIRALACSDRVVLAPTVPVRSFCACLEHCQLVISTDSFALHAAIAMSTPVVGFFGPTGAAEIEFFGRGSAVTTPLECRTCWLRECSIEPSCSEVQVSDLVLAAAKRYLT